MPEYLEDEQITQELLIDNEPVKLKSPGMKALPYFLKVARDMAKAGKNATVEDMMGNLTDNSIDSLTKMIELTINKTFPDMDKDKLDEWVTQNNVILMMKVMELFQPKQSNNVKDKLEKIQRLQHDKSTE